MRLLIEHRTTFRFPEPQPRLIQMLRVTPQNNHDQTVVAWRIDVDRDVRMREDCDGWGNAVTMLYVDGPLDGIEIAVSGEVVTSESGGVLHGVRERFPPTLFLRDTTATARDPAIALWAGEVARGADRLADLHRLNAALGERIAIDPHRAGVELAAGEAWQQERATAGEIAQLFVAAARSLGTPARYVSGYGLIGGERAPQPHGWAEAHVDGIGWIGFDPVTRLSPQDRHVRVAVALDAAGAAPIAGSRLGPAVEVLTIDASAA
ncbi:transglutaminase family protein [Sphingomonas rubra]|uniref:Transglutaminase-like enzyme, putative cysteine protease n=1 Tax=Sphingomonas rubra TaxID=634430 RepID=A0A1I5U546_9SPHN|nr:transglutaminase family protein [Sphingomonas rubra]SFP90379.1 Transglutaminase-like enzyme, putative cysteine protease [Sphingomonas rubra]